MPVQGNASLGDVGRDRVSGNNQAHYYSGKMT